MTDVMTIREVAAELKTSASTVKRLLSLGQLPCLRIGPRTIRVRREDLDAFVGAVAQGGKA
jgi:excisionase family DNA binding protein